MFDKIIQIYVLIDGLLGLIAMSIIVAVILMELCGISVI